jgi:hypothetical protein
MCRSGTAYLCRQHKCCTVEYCSKHKLIINHVINVAHRDITVYTAEKSMLYRVLIDCTAE